MDNIKEKVPSFAHYIKTVDRKDNIVFCHGTQMDDVEDCLGSEASEVRIIPVEDWGGEDFAFAWSEICETFNKHKMAGHIENSVNEAAKQSGIAFGPGESGTVFLKQLIVSIVNCNNWGYLYLDEPENGFIDNDR